MMPVEIFKEFDEEAPVFLANPVWFRITPLTVQQALDRMIITSYPDDDSMSPNRASTHDLDLRIRRQCVFCMKL